MQDKIESDQGDRYCTECGSPIKPGMRFCTNCGAPVQDSGATSSESVTESASIGRERVDNDMADGAVDAETAPGRTESDIPAAGPAVPAAEHSVSSGELFERSDATAASRPAVAPIDFNTGSPAEQRRSKKKTILIVVAALVIVVVAATAVYLAISSRTGRAPGAGADIAAGSEDSGSRNAKEGQDDGAGSAADDDLRGIDISGVNLSHTYTSTLAAKSGAGGPTFKFAYPDKWNIEKTSVSTDSEHVALSNSYSPTIYFDDESPLSRDDSSSSPKVTITRIADAKFSPGTSQGKSYKDLGKFIVAKVEMAADQPADPPTVFLALVPEKALKDTDALRTDLARPQFEYGNLISFYCYYDDGVYSKEEQQQLVAILASLTVSDSPQTSSSDSTSDDATSKASDYVLPDSDKRYMGESELDKLSTEDLFFARNEIYARHGREFNSDKLNSFFKGKSWYHPTVAPDAFDASVLNDCEHKNLDAIHKIEVERSSPYID
ncbi:hypothetical protein Corgl_1526 [Coriobacterium glomerans PW2]|uniref:YARHG domain-containing protein n=1 Tax=Coriobacterium glomerans (strain ATCC 49209 / DSM 20642 / JCM 10262 / PW2) TaxID=700015 RepID=F2NAU7_CORGP|nr:YARHG domain-containing protein [Coriobacterium glomerans]AEB07625.1 hypothetical protein Corgl_1526 [Coriobacterium glomerans PW2]